jgi:hypothetical protein
MKKVKLIGIKKSEKHNYYGFSKTREVFGIIRALLEKIGFEAYDYGSFARPRDSYGEPISDKEDDIKDYTDRREVFEKNGYYIEIIFGKEKVFLMIHTDSDKQEFLAKFLSQFILE